MKDLVSLLLWISVGLWYLYVFRTFPEAPNAPPVGSRYRLAYRLFWGKRGWMAMIGLIAIGIVFRFIHAALDQGF